MSEEQEYVSAYEQIMVMNCCALAASALVFYEHVITLSTEIRLLRSSKITGSTILFLLNRYLIFTISIVQVLLICPWYSPLSCQVMNILSMPLDLGQYICIAGFSALRAFALSGRKLWPALVILSFLALSVALNVYAYSRVVPAEIVFLSPTYATCNWGFNISLTYNTMLVYTTGACTILCDLIVLVITWMETYRILKAARVANRKTSLTTLLLRDGTIYFVLLVILTLINMISNSAGQNNNNVWQDITYFQAIIPNIIIGRFLMNLQDYTHDDGEETSLTHPNGNSSLEFSSRIVGTMSAVLDYGGDEIGETEVDEFGVGEGEFDFGPSESFALTEAGV